MQTRSKTYLQLVSLWRSFRDFIPLHSHDSIATASPPLIYVAIVLTALVAILEMDAHRDGLASLGLASIDCPIDPAFMSP